jgi:hypothetical protein
MGPVPDDGVYAGIAVTPTDAFIPEFWSQESLGILEESMLLATIAHKDFEGQFGVQPLRGFSREPLPSGI